MKPNRHIIYGLLIFAPLIQLNAQNRAGKDDVQGKSTKPTKDTVPRESSSFWSLLAENIGATIRQRDSLDKYYKEHPIETRKYVETYLVTKQIFPNNDAIELIKALNPHIKDLKEINFYTTLKMPSFKRLDRSDRQRLRKEQRQLKKWDKESQANYTSQLRDFESAVKRYQATSIRFSSASIKNDIDKRLSEISRNLTIYNRQRLMKGTAIFLTNEVKALTGLLNDMVTKKSAQQVHQVILIDFNNNLSQPSLLGVVQPLFDPYPGSREVERMGAIRNGLWNANSEMTGNAAERFFAPAPIPITNTSELPATARTCEIYAKQVISSSANGKVQEVDIPLQYFFAYETFGNAVFNCRKNGCTGFIEKQELVSANGVNLIPGNYVFRFRDRTTNKIYSRCLTMADFKSLASSGGRKRFKIIFNPDTMDCSQYLNW